MSPVATVKAFFVAIAARDKAKIRSLSLPSPRLPTLWAHPLSKKDRVSVDRVLKHHLRGLKAGEHVPMEGGDLIVPPGYASDTAVLVYGRPMLYPFPL